MENTPVITLINCEINIFLAWSDRYFVMDNNIVGQEPTFTITDTKLYVPVVTLSNQDYAKLFKQLKSGFKRTIKLNRYEPKVTKKQQKKYLNFLIHVFRE